MNTHLNAAQLQELGLLPMWTRRSLVAEPLVSRDAAIEPPAEALAAEIPAPKHAPQAHRRVADPPVPTQPVLVVDPARAHVIATLDWEPLKQAVANCTACGLCQSRIQTVFGVGNPQAEWLVVGEAPGADEDRIGEPFVGQAGNLLDNMLAAAGRSRSDNAYILNTLKCRPPQNRNPEPAELAQCAPFMRRQIELIRPRVILATGRFAVQALLGLDASISSLRGKVHDYRGIPVIVTYHPAFLLRNLPDKLKAWEDLLLANRALDAAAKCLVSTPQNQASTPTPPAGQQ